MKIVKMLFQIKDINKMENLKLNENILPDDYPVYGDYLYVCDGKVIRCDLMSGTVRDLKMDLRSYYKLEALEIKNCDIEGRKNILNKTK
jgi:hypothetical protein